MMDGSLASMCEKYLVEEKAGWRNAVLTDGWIIAVSWRIQAAMTKVNARR